MQASRVLLLVFLFDIVLILFIRSVKAPSPFHRKSKSIKKGSTQLTTPLLEDSSITHRRPPPKSVDKYKSNPRKNRNNANTAEQQLISETKHVIARPIVSEPYRPPKWDDVKGN